ncbi:hypothetical protein J2X32_004206, partial [Rheinheimera pacifica]|uniref:condensation domain-containing protein n=1 Tax=Rheinheimera pacifica TaxID=173990 RepID=UPI00285BD517
SIQLAARASSEGIAFSLEDLFEHDTVAALAAAISAEQTDETRQSQTAPFELITDDIRRQLPADIEDAYPVSQLQQGMLYHSLLHKGKGIYHDILHYHTALAFDETCFRKALQLLTQQHAMLRTEIALDTYALPLQLVHQKVAPHLNIVELKSDVQSGLATWQQQELQAGFSKDACPLIRFTALLTPDAGFYLGLSFHHAILDGWSEASLVAELMALYSAMLNGREQPLMPLSTGYCDFIAREQSALADQAQHDYWHRSAKLNISRVLLPGSTAANADEFCTDTPVSAAVSCVLDAATSRGIRRLATEQGCSLKTIMLSAHLKALSLACASDAVVSGVSFHGRPELVDSEKVLGLFVNILPVAMSVPEGSWTELISAVEACYKQVMQYRFYPLAEIKRRRGGEEPFEASFNYTQFNVLWQEDSEAGTQLNDQRGGVAENSLPFSVNVQSYPDRDEIYLSVTTLRSHYAAGVGLSYSRLYRQVLA